MNPDELVVDDFVLLAESRVHPAAREIERRSAERAHAIGVLADVDDRRFAAFNILTPYVYPTASLERALVCAQWCNWLFFFDDVHDESEDACKDPARVEARMRAYLALLRDGGPATDPLGAYALDFRARALELCGADGPAWLARFCESVEHYFLRGTLGAIECWNSRTAPAYDDYLLQRELDSAVHTAIDLIELANGFVLDDATAHSEVMRRARVAVARTIAYFNDIVSYPKEVVVNGNPNNLVHVLVTERGHSVEAAYREACRLANRHANELLAAGDELLAFRPGSRELEALVRGLRRWQRGNIDYSLVGRRYRSPTSPFRELRT